MPFPGQEVMLATIFKGLIIVVYSYYVHFGCTNLALPLLRLPLLLLLLS
jgi:hypothetical protein